MHTLQGIAVYLVKSLGCTNINLLILATIFLKKLPIYLQCINNMYALQGIAVYLVKVLGCSKHRAVHPDPNFPEQVINPSNPLAIPVMCMYCRALWCAWSICLAAPT